MGTPERAVPGLVQPALRRARAARALRGGRLDHARKPRPLVRRRAEHRWPARAGHHGARDARRRRLLVPRLSPLPAERRRRGARAGGAGRGPRRRRRPVGVRERDRPGRARRDGDDQLLQLRLLRPLHPLRHEVARRPSGDARARPRSGRRRRRPRLDHHRPCRPQDRSRAGVRARLRRLPRAAVARAARCGTALGDPRPASSSPSSAPGSA